jgi:hypothetical protein
VDLAANYFGANSLTYLMDACLNFSGICIEPNPRYHGFLTTRRSCDLVKTCIAEKPEFVEFDFGGETGFRGGIVGKYKHEQQGSNLSIVRLQCTTLYQVFHQTHVRHIDYMNLDVEGLELQCLRGMDFTKIVIDIIQVEQNPGFEITHSLLVSEGYSMVMNQRRYYVKKLETETPGLDALYVHHSAIAKLDQLQSWKSSHCPHSRFCKFFV